MIDATIHISGETLVVKFTFNGYEGHLVSSPSLVWRSKSLDELVHAAGALVVAKALQAQDKLPPLGERLVQMIRETRLPATQHEPPIEELSKPQRKPSNPEPHKPDHCDVCNAPQYVAPNGDHLCGSVQVNVRLIAKNNKISEVVINGVHLAVRTASPLALSMFVVQSTGVIVLGGTGIQLYIHVLNGPIIASGGGNSASCFDARVLCTSPRTRSPITLAEAIEREL